MLDECRRHGGPVTPESLLLLDGLTKAQLLVETRYLRSTIAPNIKERRAVIDSTGKKKMPLLSEVSLRENIRTAVKFEIKAVDNIDALIEETSKVFV